MYVPDGIFKEQIRLPLSEITLTNPNIKQYFSYKYNSSLINIVINPMETTIIHIHQDESPNNHINTILISHERKEFCFFNPSETSRNPQIQEILCPQ